MRSETVDGGAADAMRAADDDDVDGNVGKTPLRRAVIARRRQVPAEVRAQAGERLALAAGELVSGCTPGMTVAAYVSMGSEIPMRPLLQALLDRGVRLLVPMLGRGMDVGWGELGGLDDLRPVGGESAKGGDDRDGEADETHAVTSREAASGDVTSADVSSPAHRPAAHRPAEPVNTRVCSAAALRDASLVILPALLVDRSGVRLGRGGGWYDRALMHRDTAARTVAVCWPWEVVDAPLPREPHDVPVDAVLTPDALTWFATA